MIGIETKFLPATSKLTGRFRAKLTAGNGTSTIVTATGQKSKTVEENHIAVAKALAEKMNWSGVWVSAYTPTGFIFACLRTHDGSRLPVIRPGDVAFVTEGVP